MAEDFISFEKELLDTTREAIQFSKLYLDARKECSHCFNQLQILIQRANLHTSKKSIENKITELMASELYGETARYLNKKMLTAESEYKSYEIIVKTYLAHSSALQSVIKTQISAENLECVKMKYDNN